MDPMIPVVTAQRRVAVRREHLEDAARELQDRDVERAAAEIVDGVRALRRVVEAVGDRRRRRLVQEPQHGKPREFRGVLGRLPLRVVEIGRHRDDRAGELAREACLGANAQRAQDVRRNFDRAFHAGAGRELHHPRLVDEPVGKAPRIRKIGEATAHHPLHRDDGVMRIARLQGLRRVPDVDRLLAVTDDRGQQRMAVLVRQHDGNAISHGRHERIGGAEIDADRELGLAARRLVGLGNLQQGH